MISALRTSGRTPTIPPLRTSDRAITSRVALAGTPHCGQVGTHQRFGAGPRRPGVSAVADKWVRPTISCDPVGCCCKTRWVSAFRWLTPQVAEPGERVLQNGPGTPLSALAPPLRTSGDPPTIRLLRTTWPTPTHPRLWASGWPPMIVGGRGRAARMPLCLGGVHKKALALHHRCVVIRGRVPGLVF